MYENITPESIEQNILGEITQFDTREGSFARTLISPASYEIWKGYTALEGVPDMIFVTEDSGQYIDKKAADFGIIRKPGVKAAGTITFTGRNGTVIPAGKVFLTLDGLGFTLDKQVIIPQEGTAQGTITAQDVGEIYNVEAGEISVQQSPLSGLTSFSNGETTGGVNRETDAQLVARYYDYIRKPATSGNVYQYEQWAESVNGVGQAKVFPLWAGNGTVKVVISSQDYGEADPEVVEACKEYIESVRPIGATVTVESAQPLKISIAAQVKLDSTTTIGEIKPQFEQAAAAYLRDIAFQKDEVIYNRLLFLLLDIDGVQDVPSMTVNGGTENIPIGDTQVPELETVSLTSDSARGRDALWPF